MLIPAPGFPTSEPHALHLRCSYAVAIQGCEAVWLNGFKTLSTLLSGRASQPGHVLRLLRLMAPGGRHKLCTSAAAQSPFI